MSEIKLPISELKGQWSVDCKLCNESITFDYPVPSPFPLCDECRNKLNFIMTNFDKFKSLIEGNKHD